LPRGLVVAFIDIGQGDATVVQLPDGTDGVVIDCGKTGTHRVYSYLDESGIQRLRLVLLSHSDDDHVGGIMGVLENFRGVVDEISFNPDRLMGEAGDRRYRLFLRQLAQFIRSRNCRQTYPAYPHQWTFNSVTIHILHPAGPDRLEALARNLRNDVSVLVLAEYEGERLLLAADIQGVGWQWVASRESDLTARVFKLPHHGAWYTAGLGVDQVLQMVQPELIVISVGASNPYRHPAQQTIQALVDYLARRKDARVLCTQLDASSHPGITAAGTIRVEISPSGMSVSTMGATA
jgi:competence protein ComEC